MSEHALLSASSASRWMACPPSARLGEGYPETTSVYAEEGKLAHKLAELMLTLITKPVCTDADKASAKNAIETAPPEMLRLVQDYYDLCVEKINTAISFSSDAKILLEQRLDFSDWVEAGFGTGDMA